MKSLIPSLLLLVMVLSPCLAQKTPCLGQKACCNVPGSTGYPPTVTWSVFNATISGCLIEMVPSAKYCMRFPEGTYTDAQWASGLFRSTIPRAMNQVNFEQDYDLIHTSLFVSQKLSYLWPRGCAYLFSGGCSFISQTAAKFAGTHNRRERRIWAPRSLLAVEFILRPCINRERRMASTAFSRILDAVDVWTPMRSPYAQVGTHPRASVFLDYHVSRTRLNAVKAVLSAGDATVCQADMYKVPATLLYQFNIVVASGELLKVNSISYSDLLYALRGGEAGSWRIIVSATFGNFPTFNSTSSSIRLVAEDNTAAGAVASAHTQHIFDLDPLRVRHSFSVSKNTMSAGSTDGAYVVVTVKLGSANGLCSGSTSAKQWRSSKFLYASSSIIGVQCPAEKGIYEIVQTIGLPIETSPTKLTVNARGYTADDEDLMCVDIVLDFGNNI
ncbi:hypothetical protein C8R44DRAFT_736051 [Mycena epipterygia]|nr:hypothetical protein C8R44DRAFT_736051 [Mycena epipterygia]